MFAANDFRISRLSFVLIGIDVDEIIIPPRCDLDDAQIVQSMTWMLSWDKIFVDVVFCSGP